MAPGALFQTTVPPKPQNPRMQAWMAGWRVLVLDTLTYHSASLTYCVLGVVPYQCIRSCRVLQTHVFLEEISGERTKTVA